MIILRLDPSLVLAPVEISGKHILAVQRIVLDTKVMKIMMMDVFTVHLELENLKLPDPSTNQSQNSLPLLRWSTLAHD